MMVAEAAAGATGDVVAEAVVKATAELRIQISRASTSTRRTRLASREPGRVESDL